MTELREIRHFSGYCMDGKGTVYWKDQLVPLPITRWAGRNDTVYIKKDGAIRYQHKSIVSLLKDTFPELYYPKPLESIIIHREGDEPPKELNAIQQLLQSQYYYNRDTGDIIRLATGKSCLASRGEGGYLEVNYEGLKYLAQNFIMLMMLGDTFDEYEVDHVDHDKANNRWNNLRIVDSKTNTRNLSKAKSNKSGYTGVSFHKPTGKWRAHIMVNYRQVHLGLFSNMDDAIAARKEADIKYNFHENHGK